MGIQQRLLAELFLLRNRVRDMAVQRDLLIRQVRASPRWKLMKEWLEGRTEHWDPEENIVSICFGLRDWVAVLEGFSQSARGPSRSLESPLVRLSRCFISFSRTCFSLNNGFLLPFLILSGTMISRNEFLFPASFVS